MTEDEMIGWHHQLDGHGFGCTLGVGDGQGGMACSWGRKESDTTGPLNGTEHTSKVMFKILQGMNQRLPDVQVGFRKGRGTRDQIANIHWIIEKAR